ncbi:DUF3606 domain-containing protein [Aureimonas sp. ME7]|uniref:DUF3606 domain-containing protein n=1 Tax=Aureimonas sp. ME7 TaxID=2744252 RepID=UPI0015F3B5D4|nr:DUF3606 domain-containing protein [Aureimonas sp. ME7]
MSNVPVTDQTNGMPDNEAEELAAKHGISVEDAKRIIEERGHDRASKDGAAEEIKSANG